MKDIILYAIPVFAATLLIEVFYYRRLGIHSDHYNTRDTVGSLLMGVGNVVVGFLAKLLVAGALIWVYQFRLWTPDRTNLLYWGLLFLADDFSYYWFHRSSHKIRYFWASHVVHHSSEYYNLGTALRQTWTGSLTGAFVFYLWMPLVGFHPVDVLLMQAISLLYQYWIHTEAIKKLPRPLEWVFNTPSHHRVHHGADVPYLDKNHGGILIIWDRIFGTFKEEGRRPTYGLTANIHSHSPFVIAFHEWLAIAKDVRRAPSLRAMLQYVLGPPGWSHDGSRKTVQQLQKEKRDLERKEKGRAESRGNE
jgi:sterol desaturase/sphingolipid hydroxylase (fatty acid hydroxylase superfamily)